MSDADDGADTEITPAAVSGVRVSSGLIANSSVLSQLDLALLVGVGVSEATLQPVLVPLVEWSLVHEEDEPLRTAHILALENVGFVIDRLATELAEVTGQLADISRGRIQPDAAEIASVVDALKRARDGIDRSLENLEPLAPG